jgi:3'(2'), 5'-bisphosphate nucleotidase
VSGLARELAEATALAERAGALVVAARAAGLVVEHKAGDEPVTAADRDASTLIVAGLHAAFPADVVVSEELEDDLARLGADRVWFVDPIDGTKDFIRGGDGFAVMIGLVVGGVPVVGVVHQPSIDRTFAAIAGQAATVRERGQPARAIAVSTVSDPAQARLVASASHRSAVIDDVKEALGTHDELNIGSVGVKLALIAAGARDLYVNPAGRCKAWDTCAPEVILRAAGGVLTNLHGDPLRYDQPDLRLPHGLVGSNQHLHAAVVGKLAALFPRRPA